MVQWWKNDGPVMKQRWHDGEITMMQWHDDGNNIAVSSSYHRIFTIVASYFYHCTIKFSPSCIRCFTIVALLFHHRTIVVSRSYHRVLTIVHSRFHNRTIVSSSFHHCTIANGIPYVSVYVFKFSQSIFFEQDILELIVRVVGFKVKIS
jgi:hypothetical protein